MHAMYVTNFIVKHQNLRKLIHIKLTAGTSSLKNIMLMELYNQIERPYLTTVSVLRLRFMTTNCVREI